MKRFANCCSGRSQDESQSLDTLVIGGSQAGLTVGYHLRRHGVACLLEDEHERSDSVLVGGVRRDAKHVDDHTAARRPERGMAIPDTLGGT